MQLLVWIINAYIIICIVRVALSWLDLSSGGGGIIGTILQTTVLLTEPVFSAVRSRLPRMGDIPIDFSPMIVIFVLFILRGLVSTL